MKKILFAILLVFSLMNVVSAESFSESLLTKDQPAVAILIHIDPTNVNKPTEAAEGIYSALQEDLSENNAQAIPYEETRKVLRRYIRENDFSDNARESDFGFVPKRKDLEALAKELNADYVLFISSRVTSQEVKRNFWTGERKHSTILFDVVLFRSNDGEYLIDDMYTDTGKTQGSFERAYKRATKNIMEQIDLSSINFTKSK